MPLLRRRRPVPPAVAGLQLEPGERREAWAATPDDEAVVATDRALLLPGDVRIAWPDVERATWQPPVLTVLGIAEVEGAGVRHVVELVDERDLPQVVRARVTGSVLWSSHTRLDPAGGVRVVGRRRPGVEGLSWQLVFDRGTDRADPFVRAQADRLLEDARRAIG